MIAALFAALIGPFFVDWNAYRSTFETYAERALGHRVTVLGRADARLLPTPTLIFSDVRVGEAEDPLMVVSRFEARIELAPLLSGEIRVVDMRLEEPQLNLSLDESGRVDWLTAATQFDRSQIDPAAVQLNSVDIQNGRIEVIDARTGDTYVVENVNLNVSARSLQGPYRIEGSGMVNGAHHSLRVGTGRPDPDGKTRVKAEIVPAELPFSLQLDGLLGEQSGAPLYSGDFVLASVALVEVAANGAANNAEASGANGAGFGGTGQQASLWQSEGTFELDPVQLEVGEFGFRYGREDRPFRLDGQATVAFGAAPRFDANVTSKQVDLDRIFGAGPKDPVAIDRAAASILASLKNLPLPPIPGAVRLKLPGLVAGGGIIQDIVVNAETLPRGWRIAELEAQLPGRSRFTSSGELNLGAEPSFEGRVKLASRQPSAFVAWWRKGLPAKPLSLDAFEIGARVELSSSALVLTGLEGEVGSSGFTGAATWRRVADGKRSVVTADLDADRLDLDQLLAVAQFFPGAHSADGGKDANAPASATLANTDISVRLAIDDLRMSGTRADSVELVASYAQDALTVERFHAADLAGAQISAEGRVSALTSAPDGRFEATFEAEKLDGVRTVLARLFPQSPLVSYVGQASEALAPAKLSANFSARSAASVGSKASLVLNGQLGDSTIEAKGDFSGRVDEWRDAEVDIAAKVRAADAVQLLRQAAFDVVPLEGMGAANVDLSAVGMVQSGLDVQLAVNGIASQLDAQGSIGFPMGKPALYGLDLVVASDDITPFGLMSGRVLPVLGGVIPLKGSVRLDGEALAVTLRDFDADIGAAKISGTLEGNLAAARPTIKGNLRTNTVNVGLLSELILGADAWSSVDGGQTQGASGELSRGRWPSGAFGTPFLRDTSVRLDVVADSADIGLSRDAAQVRFSLQASDSELAIDDFDAAFEGGRLAGSLLIKRSNGEAGVSGNIKASDVDLEGLVWRRNGRPLARGLLDLSIDFEGAGRSVSGIVAGLAGGGTFRVRDGELRGLNTAAFGSVIRAVDAGLTLENDAIRTAFESHLDAGNLPFKTLEGSLALAAGTARARNVTIDTDRAKAFGTAFIDLQRWQVESDWSLKVDPGDNAVTGAEPQVGVLFRGSLDDPHRKIDIAPLTAFLTLRAFEQEVRRVEKLQADILERERFLRELRMQRQQRIRREREQAAATEAAANRAAAGGASETATGEASAPEASNPGTPDTAAAPQAQPLAGNANDNVGISDAVLSPDDFARRIRPAIEEAGALRLQPLLPAQNALGQDGVVGEPINLQPLQDAPLDNFLDQLSDTGPNDATRETPNRSQSSSSNVGSSRPSKAKVPRYIMGPSNRVVPNPAYPGN